MESKMHESGLHCHYPTYKTVVLIETVSRKKQVFSKGKINDAEQEKQLYVKLGYPSVKDIRWIFKANRS